MSDIHTESRSNLLTKILNRLSALLKKHQTSRLNKESTLSLKENEGEYQDNLTGTATGAKSG